MNINKLHPTEQLAITMARTYNMKLTSSKGGNLSLKDDEGNIWITPGGTDKRALTKEDIIKVTPDGKVYGIHPVSSEFPLHKTIYESCPDIRSIMHAHPPALVMYSLLREIPEVKIIPDLANACVKPGVAKYATPGTAYLGEALAEEINCDKLTLVMENHGICVVGDTVFGIYSSFESLEQAALINRAANVLGESVVLSDAQINDYNNSYLFERYDEFVHEVISDEEKSARALLCDVSKRAYEKKIMFSSLGATSQRTGDNSFVITPEDGDPDMYGPEDMVCVSEGMCEKGKTPSHWAKLHEKIYKKHPEIKSIMTALPANLMAYAVTHTPLNTMLMTEAYVFLRDIPNIPYEDTLKKSDELAEMICKSCPMVIQENLCATVIGKDAFDAFVSMEAAEDYADGMLEASALGEVKMISDKDIEDLKKLFSKYGG